MDIIPFVSLRGHDWRIIDIFLNILKAYLLVGLDRIVISGILHPGVQIKIQRDGAKIQRDGADRSSY